MKTEDKRPGESVVYTIGKTLNPFHGPIAQCLRIAMVPVSIGVATLWPGFWWVPCLPWALLNILGIVATIPQLIPLLFVIGLSAGTAQADWMSDGFVYSVCFVLPTAISIAFSHYIRLKIELAVGCA